MIPSSAVGPSRQPEVSQDPKISRSAAPGHTWPELFTCLLSGQDLPPESTGWAMEQVMSGLATPAQLAAFLTALRGKGETVGELSGLVEVMLRHAVRIEVPGPAVDVVGTGGDRMNTVNLSTMAAIVTAGAGRRVVKHGNRAASSAAGTADVLEALGVRLDLPAERVAALACEVGITFCFAQTFHPAMRHAAVTRRELGIPTVFNVLGPLTNPARPAASAIGVADRRMAPLIAGVLAERGDSALVFRGEDGLDELSTVAPNQVWQVADGEITVCEVDPAEVGLPRARLADLVGGDPRHNAEIVRVTLDGRTGPVRDAVLLNAAAAIVAVDTVHRPGADSAAKNGTKTVPSGGSLPERLRQGLEIAAESIDSGRAALVLESWIAASRA
ncbi:MAG: anthranilate phosphoribosyltransferase [Actinomycetota bacterium]|nr:anthranilate phosphoribosyltransferase [Actinomycetota bacterium]